MTFLKLDTGVIAGFDKALGTHVCAVSTRPMAVLRRLAARRGWGHAVVAMLHHSLVPGHHAWCLVAGNITRKRIRLPFLFNHALVATLYGHIKAGQAAVLRCALEAEMSAFDPGIVIIFNGSLYPESVLAHVSANRPRVFVEAGFFPGTLQIDANGLNAANSVPRDPAFYLETSEDFAALGLPSMVNDRTAKMAGAGPVSLTPGYVFVPFQVPSDMQVTLQSPWIQDMEAFLDTVIETAERHPHDTFVIKEHPSFKRSVNGLRAAHPRVIFANDNVTSDLIQDARAVLTLNSTVGIEALLFGKPVITVGDSCYNIDGLVLHASDARMLDHALIASQEWGPNARLRQQFLGFLWNKYLVRGRYDALPDDLAAQIAARSDNVGNPFPTGK